MFRYITLVCILIQNVDDDIITITLTLTLVFYPTREEVVRMWNKREAEWEKEKVARERLISEVHKQILYCVLTLYT